MESLSSASRDASAEYAEHCSGTDHAGTCTDGGITDIIAADAISSSSAAEDNSSAAEKPTVSMDPYGLSLIHI